MDNPFTWRATPDCGVPNIGGFNLMGVKHTEFNATHFPAAFRRGEFWTLHVKAFSGDAYISSSYFTDDIIVGEAWLAMSRSVARRAKKVTV